MKLKLTTKRKIKTPVPGPLKSESILFSRPKADDKKYSKQTNNDDFYFDWKIVYKRMTGLTLKYH